MPSVHCVRHVRMPTMPSHTKPVGHVMTPAWASWPSQLPPGAIVPEVLSVNAPCEVVNQPSSSTKYVPAESGPVLRSDGSLHASVLVHDELSSEWTPSNPV